MPPGRRPSNPRVVSVALTLLLIIGACGDGSTTPTGSPDAPDAPASPTGNAYDHGRPPGASAADLLSSDAFDSLVVEINYVAGFRPSDEGLEILREFLEERLHKPRGIEIRVRPALEITSEPTHSVTEIQALEEQHRTAFTSGRTLAVHFLFLDGEYAEASNVLGIAYNNTSMAIFEQKIRAHSGSALQPTEATVEGVVANHEVGHLLGLVNSGSPMQTEHQDEPHGRHCDDPDCLMYYAVRTTDFIENLLGGAPSLDQNCVDDLQANGGK